MSDPKRATLITVGAEKSEKNKVNKTVRLTINLDESNESKYPELNYKELVKAEVKKKTVENGKTAGLNPFSDNDEDVERVARKFEQKYGGKSTYGRKTKADDFADIGAGYDENDSFIDNTDGYDEMIPPECETLYGGFYINSGLLEFKNADNVPAISDGEPATIRRNKRRISSSSSEAESSESSSDSDSAEEKDPKAIANGAVDTHKTEHRKKKNKKIEKKKAKKIRRTDSSAATSGKQTSDDNAPESADSRTSQSDSLTSKPAPSSENPVTSDSSRDTEAREPLPLAVSQILDQLEAAVSRQLIESPNTLAPEMNLITDPFVARLETALSENKCGPAVSKLVWCRAARAVKVTRAKLMQKARDTGSHDDTPADTGGTTTVNPDTKNNPQPAVAQKRKLEEVTIKEDFSALTEEEREAKIVEALKMLKVLIDERTPGMIASYKAECERVQEDRRKLQVASSCDGSRPTERRMPKRRFPWCGRARHTLATLRELAPSHHAAAALLHERALPLFPAGFVTMPAILKQANLSKEIKMSDIKRQRVGSVSQPQPTPQPMNFTEAIQFPSTLTVTATPAARPQKPAEKTEQTTVQSTTEKDKNKAPTNPMSVFGSIINSFSLSKDLIVVEKSEDTRKDSVIVEKPKEDYIPQSSISSVTITPVQSNPVKNDKKVNSTEPKEPLLRVKSPAALNEMAQKREKEKALENMHKEKEKFKNPEKPVDKVVKIDSQNDKQHSSSDKQNLVSDKLQPNDKNRLPNDKYHSNDKVHSTHHSSERKSDKVQSSSEKHQTNDRLFNSNEKTKSSNEKHQNDRHHSSEKGNSSSDKPQHTNEKRPHTSDKPSLSEKQLHTTEKQYQSSDKQHQSSSDRHHQNDRTHSSIEKQHHSSNKQQHSMDKLSIHPHDKQSLSDKQQILIKEKRVNSPLHIDTSYQPKQKEPTPSPKNKLEKITPKQIENMRVQENNIPRPALIPVHHSPTFIKPIKPLDAKKKKDLVIVSDLDPLGDIQSEPLAIDDSSSDVELVEDTKSDTNVKVSDTKSDSVPWNNKVSANHKDVRQMNSNSDRGDQLDEAMKEDFNSVMKGLKDLESSQEHMVSSNSYGGVITSAKRDACSSAVGRGSIFAEVRAKDKLAERTSLNKMDGCNSVNG